MGAMERIARDAGYALRSLRRKPGFAAVVVLTLALGIGANTAIFSLLHALVLRSLPVSRELRPIVARAARLLQAFRRFRREPESQRDRCENEHNRDDAQRTNAPHGKLEVEARAAPQSCHRASTVKR